MSRSLLCLVLGAAAGAGACSECSGTASCHGEPEVAITGQFINHKTGAAVPGVRLEFVRQSGIPLTPDRMTALTDANGFFTMRSGSVYIGDVSGSLNVTPPAPHAPYTIPSITATSSRTRGDGDFIGRLVVDPFFILVGEVHAVNVGALFDATVTMRRISGGRLAEDSITMVSQGHRFGWVDPPVVQFGVINAEFDIRLPNDSRVFRVQHDVPILYRDGELAFVILVVQP